MVKSEIVSGFIERWGGGWIASWKIVCLPAFSFHGRNPQTREKENINERRPDCDLGNISVGFGSQTKIKRNQMCGNKTKGEGGGVNENRSIVRTCRLL